MPLMLVLLFSYFLKAHNDIFIAYMAMSHDVDKT